MNKDSQSLAIGAAMSALGSLEERPLVEPEQLHQMMKYAFIAIRRSDAEKATIETEILRLVEMIVQDELDRRGVVGDEV